MKSSRYLRYSCALLLISACAAHQPPGDALDLSAWQQYGDANWSFDGALLSVGPSAEPGYLVSREAYSELRLSIEFFVDDDTNSGVFVNCLEPQEMADLNPDDCYEVNIWDNHPVQDFRTGAIVKRARPAAHVNTTGRWNQMVVESSADRIEVMINGVRTVSLANEAHNAGFIALQYAGTGRIRFRALSIEQL